MPLHPTTSFGIAAAMALAAAVVAAPLRAAEPPSAGMIVVLLGDDDAAFRAIGLDGVRHAARGDEATRRFAAVLRGLPPERQIELLGALADRGDAGAVPAITAVATESPDGDARAASIAALGRLGGAAEVPILLQSLAATKPVMSAARRALIEIRGDDAEGRIIAAAKPGSGSPRSTIIDVLAARRARTALPDLVAMTCDTDPGVRAAAMRACGEFGGPAEVPGMIAGLVASAPGDERRQAERAIVTVCTQGRGHEAAARIFLETFESSPRDRQEPLLPALGGIGGPAALAIVDGLIASGDPRQRRMGLEAIARWPDATVASRLLDLVTTAEDPAERDLLIGALVRIAPLPDNKLDNSRKLDLVKKTMALCRTDMERARLIERANAIRTLETFRYVTGFLDTPALAEAACASVVELAHHRQLRDANKDEFGKALDKVIDTTKNPELGARAAAYKAGKTWARKKG